MKQSHKALLPYPRRTWRIQNDIPYASAQHRQDTENQWPEQVKEVAVGTCTNRLSKIRCKRKHLSRWPSGVGGWESRHPLITSSGTVLVKVLVAQSCLTLCNCMEASPPVGEHGGLQSVEFSRQEYWSGLPFPSPGDLPNPGIEPRSSALEAFFTNWAISEAPKKPDRFYQCQFPGFDIVVV